MIPLLAIAAPLVGAVAIAVCGDRPTARALWTAVASLFTFAVVLVLFGRVLDGEVPTVSIGELAPGVELLLRVDAASMVFALSTAGLWLLASLYSFGYMNGAGEIRQTRFFAVFAVCVSTTIGLAFAGNLFTFFVFYELLTLATYPLVIHKQTPAAVASYRYLLIGTVGSSLYLLGVGFIYFTTGSLSMESVGPTLAQLTGSPTTAAAVALIVIGLGIKMAIFPLHVWLPDAHSHAPPGIAALLASVQVKVAAYALIRILLDVFGPAYVSVDVPVMTLLVWFGAAGIVVGSAMAIRQRDIKRMLAHSTVAQLGYIAVGIGLATPLALIGALLHVVNHAVMKALLFFVAGSVIDRAGTKKLAQYAGLGALMPTTMAAFSIAAVSMVGLPPTAGFISKWYLVSGAVEVDNWLVAIVIVASSVLTLAYFLRVMERIWFRPPAEDAPVPAADIRESRPVIVAVVVLLAVAVIGLGLFSVILVDQVLEPVAVRLLG